MELPLCTEEYEPELNLTVADRRELFLRLAERGVGSMDKYILDRSEVTGSGIARMFKNLRSKLDAQVSRMRERIENKFKRRYEDAVREQREEVEFEQFSADFPEDEHGLGQARMSYVDRKIDSRLAEILARDEVLNLIINFEDEGDKTKTKLGWWARFKDALRRFINYITNLFRRFINWLKGRPTRQDHEPATRRRQKSKILLRYRSGSALGDNIDHNLDNALASSPEFRSTIDRKLSGGYAKRVPSRRRVTWKKYFNREEYAEEVRKELDRRIKHAIKREQRKLEKEYKAKARRLKKLAQRRRDKTHQEVQQRETEARLKQLEKQKAEELRKLQERYSANIQKTVQKELVRELEDAGYLQKGKDQQPNITSRLIDRFAEIVLSDELKKLPSKYTWGRQTHGLPHGIYEKKRLQTVSEGSRMDIVASLVNARVSHPSHRHIEDSDIITHRELRSNISHVVLMFDKSGSMEENNRIQAAKKSVLALYKAVKHRNPRNIVDFIAFDSTVKIMDILQAWRSTPSGFTNTGEALATANSLMKDSVADRKLIYLITDGLPEAYTDPQTGEPRAGDLEKSLSVAVKEAKKLKKYFTLKFTIILLEPKENVYAEAADTIAKAAGGRVIVTDPQELATEMLMDYIEV
ncbi:VWA domain-containing protein [[Eubacterium] cellulosolvens]